MTDSNVDYGRARTILIKQAARAYRRGEGYRWPVCVAARRLTLNHRYEHDVKRSFAKALRVSISAVDNMSFAGSTYRVLRNWTGMYGNPKLLHMVRRHLRFTHFAVLGTLWSRYEFDPPVALDYLYKATRYRLTVEQMRQMIESDQAIQEGKPPAVSGDLDGLDSRHDLAQQQRHHAQLAGARPARVLAVDEDSDGLRVTLATERRGGVRVGQEALVVFVNGDE